MPLYTAYRHLRALLTPWCRVLLEKLTGLQLVKKFPAFHGARMFIIALTSVRHLSLSWASPIQSIYPHPTSWRSILILSTHLRLGLPSGLFPYLRATVGLFHGLFQDDLSNWSYVASNGWTINEKCSRIHMLVLKQTCTTVLCHVLVDNFIIFLEIFHSSSDVILIRLAVFIATDGRNELFTLTSGLYWFSWSVPYELSITQRHNPTCRSQKADVMGALTSCRS